MNDRDRRYDDERLRHPHRLPGIRQLHVQLARRTVQDVRNELGADDVRRELDVVHTDVSVVAPTGRLFPLRGFHV